jgi:hypothetical protein
MLDVLLKPLQLFGRDVWHCHSAMHQPEAARVIASQHHHIPACMSGNCLILLPAVVPSSAATNTNCLIAWGRGTSTS